jgi:hypothetical protein
MKQSELLQKIEELEERTALMRGMILGTHDRITAMENSFARCVTELSEIAVSIFEKKTVKKKK